MVIVDTTVWIDYLRGVENAQTGWMNRELARQRLGLTDLILCEVLQGVRPRSAGAVRSKLLAFEVFETGSIPLALDAASHYQYLRERGHTVRTTIDCLIATFCLRNGHSLLHRDRDFDAFESVLGLHVIHV
jgi:predicted nucleic acid-binding protein